MMFVVIVYFVYDDEMFFEVFMCFSYSLGKGNVYECGREIFFF